MENQRLFLVMAALFILFLLWENWIAFEARKHPPPPTVTSAPGPTGQAVPQPPGAPAQDVPSGAAPGAIPAPAALESGQRVKVATDLYEVEIDTIGGDLRQVGLRTYPQSLQNSSPFMLLQDNKADLFIVQSGLGSTTGPAPNHYARFLPEQTEYRLQDGQDSLEVRLNWSEGGIDVVKTYTFHRHSFVIDLNQRVRNTTSQEWRGWQYRQLQRTPPPTPSGSWLSGGIYTYTGGIISTPEKPYEKLPFDKMAEENLDLTVSGGWVAIIQHYFFAALIPAKEQSDTFYSKVIDGNRFVLGLRGPPQSIAANGEGNFATRLYVGPKIQSVLDEIAPNLRLTVDYGILTVIAQPLFWLLKAIHHVLGNWGWAIVILTILIRGAFFKLSETSYRSMARMRNVAPKITALKERYGDDKQRLNQAMMELYKQEKINPLGGCLPIVVQIPVFIALYWMLLESVELRQAPFILWIHDLSEKDPYYVLPIIMGVTMVIQQKLNPPPPDPTQAKIMMMLPILFTFMFLWFPSGLVLYWVVSNTLSIIQQYVITKRMEEAAAKG